MQDKLNDLEFKKFRDLIYKVSGINFNSTNRAILEYRIKERLKKVNFSSVIKYFDLINTDHDELKIFLDSVTTNLTKFFRNISHFNALEQFVFDDLKKVKSKQKHIRLWSAGCSTGEEPYSIAMIAKEKFDSTWKVEIIASDISLNSLIKAKEGFYSKDKIENIPEKYFKKYMVQIGDQYCVKSDIKDLIQFDYHNLQNESIVKNFDLVFCKNVIIYFDGEAQNKVINMFYNSMNDYSYFFIGHSESLFGMKTKFVFTREGDVCFYMKKEGKNYEQR